MKHITEKMPIKAGKYDNVPENYTGTVYICPMHLEVRDIEMVKRLVSVADPIKPSTGDAIKLLHEAGLKVVMLTGDNEKTVQAVANKLGIDEVHADVSPEDKNRIVKEMQDNGKLVAMASTTRLHWHRLMSALPWVQVRMWQWRAQGLPC